jgi:hypothetical protein
VRAALALVAALAGPAAAQAPAFETESETWRQVWFTPTPDVPGQLGVLHYHNRLTQALDVQSIGIDTPEGPMTIILRNTPNNDCGAGIECPDTLDVVETPPGYVAVPPGIELGERGTAEIRVLRFEGM